MYRHFYFIHSKKAKISFKKISFECRCAVLRLVDFTSASCLFQFYFDSPHSRIHFGLVFHFQYFNFISFIQKVLISRFFFHLIIGIPVPRVTWFKEHALVEDKFYELPDGSVKSVLRLNKIGRNDLESVSFDSKIYVKN